MERLLSSTGVSVSSLLPALLPYLVPHIGSNYSTSFHRNDPRCGLMGLSGPLLEDILPNRRVTPRRGVS